MRTGLVLAAVAAGVAESALPRPFPFVRIGIANAVVIFALVRSGFLTALQVSVVRVLAVGLFTGLLFTPVIALSIAGCATSLLVMYLALPLSRRYISLTAVSIMGAEASLVSQLLVASVLIPGLPAGTLLVPVTAWGMVSGAFVGLFSVALLRSAGAGLDYPC